LHLASYGGHLECVQTLLEAGADVNARDDYGKSLPNFPSNYNSEMAIN
jgi:ankyrin repeat protein